MYVFLGFLGEAILFHFKLISGQQTNNQRRNPKLRSLNMNFNQFN